MYCYKLLAGFVFLAFPLLVADQVQDQGSDEVPYIEVIGTAHREVIPDEIFVRITLAERYESREKITVTEQEAKLKEALANIGIDLSQLYVKDIQAEYVKVRWHKEDLLEEKDYTLKVSDAETLKRVFETLAQLEIDHAAITRVNHSQLDRLKREVEIQAIQNAKEKADYLLAAIGQQAGPPLVIKANEILPVHLPQRNIRGSRAGDELHFIDGIKLGGWEDQELQFQKIKIEARFYVQFAIK